MKKNKNIAIMAIVICITILAISLIATIGNKSKSVASEEIYKENLNEEDSKAIIAEADEYANINELQNTQIIEEPKEEKNQTTNSSTSNPTGTTPYYIKVNYGAQVVTIYKKDSSGNYTIPVKAMVCSTGIATPKSGVYSIPNRWRWLGLQGNVYGQYCTQITGNILFHSVPYLQRGNPASLEWWEYDKLGTYASAGCIRLTVSDAIWIYNNCARGTKVEFYSSSNPGPLGKPSAKKISSYAENLKNWDPTDPDSNNPWKNYNSEENNKVQNIIDSQNKNTINQNTTNGATNIQNGDATNGTTNTQSGNTTNETTNTQSGNTASETTNIQNQNTINGKTNTQSVNTTSGMANTQKM